MKYDPMSEKEHQRKTHQQVEDVFVVNFQKAHEHVVLHPVLLGVLARFLEQVPKCQHHHAGVGSSANHRVGLPRAGLS